MKIITEFEVPDKNWHGFVGQFEKALEDAINNSSSEALEGCEIIESHTHEG